MPVRISLFLKCFFFAGVAALCLSPRAAAQNIIDHVIDIPLVIKSYSTGSGTYYKYGIHVGIGGGAPKLYEFDTGGDGFYAVYSDETPWWGNYSSTGVTLTNTYDSGLAYTATAVETSVSLYAHGSATNALLTANNVLVGQTTSIVNTNAPPTTNWPTPGPNPAPPVDEDFYGDFGLSLKPGASINGTNSIANILAQFTYTGSAKAAFVVHTGPYGSTEGAYLRIGVDQAEIDTFTKFQMQGQDTNNPFPGSTNATYSAELLSGVLNLDNSYSTNIALNLDTGNPTPGLHNVTNGVPPEYITTSDGDAYLSADLLLTLTAQEYLGTNTPTVFSLTTGTNYGSNYVYVQEKDNFYLNVGAPFFEQNDVLFDFGQGIIGLRPSTVPEVNQVWMLAMGIFGLWIFAVIRSIFFHKPKKSAGAV